MMFAASLAASCVAASDPPKPNLIWVLVDDFGYNDIGFHNAENEDRIRTPHMDFLATSPHGIRLERAYSQPICTPTRTQVLSGRYQIHTGMQHGVLWKGVMNGLPVNETTAAEHLNKLNYDTHAIGKWHIGMSRFEWTPMQRGFGSFLGFWGGSEDYWTHYQGKFLDFRDGEQVARSYTSHNQSNASYSTHLFTSRAVDIIEGRVKVKGRSDVDESAQQAKRPFFIYLAYQATHGPLQAPSSVVDRFATTIPDKSRRTFAAMAAVVDEGLANITLALRRSGAYNNTVLFLSGDNGGTVHAGGSNWPLRGYKGSLWEGGCRASALIHSPLLPPRNNGGTIWKGLIHVSDWLPTSLQLAGMTSQAIAALRLDGQPMWDALSGAGTSPRTELLHEIDRIAAQRYQCSGPIAHLDGNGSGGWSLPRVYDRFARAALHMVVNDTHWKLVKGECAGWDTDSTNIPPPNYEPPASTDPFSPAAPASVPLPAECGAPPGCNRSSHSHTGPCPSDGRGDTWLFNLDVDPYERCDLKVARPDVLLLLTRRLLAYGSSEVPVRYPDGRPELDPGRCHPPLDHFFALGEPGVPTVGCA